MGLTQGKARQSSAISRVAEGQDSYLKALRDGSLTVADWLAALSLEGRIFTANAGSATTPVTFGAGGLDTTEFDLHIAVPAGTCIIPLVLTVAYEAFGTALIVETCLISGKGSTTGTGGTAITPVSSNPNTGLASGCTVTGYPTATSGVYFTSEVDEIFRDTDQLAIDVATVGQIRPQYVKRWLAKQEGIMKVVGPSAQLAVFAAAQAGTGFIALKYAELPSASLV